MLLEAAAAMRLLGERQWRRRLPVQLHLPRQLPLPSETRRWKHLLALALGGRRHELLLGDRRA